MRNGPLLIFCLMLFSAYACGHFWFRARAAGDDRTWVARVEKAEREGGQWRLKAELARYELADWRQHVATLIPSALEGVKGEEASYPLRSVASVAAGDVESKLEIERASTLFERAKADFRAKRFDAAGEAFKVLLERYPESRYRIEARFLLAESAYQRKDYEAAVDSIDELVGNFPESELTGFALLRLGEIFERQDRREDAAEIYRAVVKAYPNADLSQQARVALKGAEL